MKRLFINHRTDDEPSTRERLLADLERRLAPGQVFIDRKGIEPGEGWEDRIAKEIESADVVFALIGPAWLTVCDAKTKVPRIWQPSDWVRYEIEVSLKQGDSADFRLVPVLFGATPLPTKEQLPESLHGLAGRQAATLRLPHEDWDRDVDALIELLVDRGFQKLDTAPKSLPPESRVPPELEALLKERSRLQIAGQDTADLDAKLRAFNAQRLRGPLLQPGYTFANNYVLEEPIGQGGFSSVWRAWDRQAGRHVALKVLHPNQSQDRSARDRFARGAKAMHDLQHDHIVRVFTLAAEQDAFWWFAMEYVPGRDLRRAVLDEKGRPDRATMLRILRDVAEALDYAHSKHVIHRDVKPANILVDPAGRAKLTDFDLVKLRDDTQLTVAIGDAWFAAPEVRDEEGEEATAASDVYSFAMTLLYALSGGGVVGKSRATSESLLAKAGIAAGAARVVRSALEEAPLARPIGVSRLLDAVTAHGAGPRGASLFELPGRESPPIWADVGGQTTILFSAGGTTLELLPPSAPRSRTSEDVHKSGIPLVQIPAGEFLIGDERGDPKERPAHRVVIAQPFWLAATAVTNAQYRKFVEATGHAKPAAWNDRRLNGDDQPVVTVSRDDAQAFCTWAGLRLPSEAEWEYACRAGTTTKFSFGDTISTDQVNFKGNYPYGDGKKDEYRQRTVAVASLPVNPWGLFEMHGNVWEWCEDTSQASQDAALTGWPEWALKGVRCGVLRGGCWFHDASGCRSASRSRWPASYRSAGFGFRPARLTTK